MGFNRLLPVPSDRMGMMWSFLSLQGCAVYKKRRMYGDPRWEYSFDSFVIRFQDAANHFFTMRGASG